MKSDSSKMMPKSQVLKLARNIQLVIFDFDGVFTDNKVIISENGEESVTCNRSDGLGLSKLKQSGVELLILSTEPNTAVKHRANKLKVSCINNCKDKLKVLLWEVKIKKLTLKQVAYIGNDINDLACLKVVGFPVVVRDAHKDVLSYGKYRTKLEGGNGAVREVCDLIYVAKTAGRADVKPL